MGKQIIEGGAGTTFRIMHSQGTKGAPSSARIETVDQEMTYTHNVNK